MISGPMPAASPMVKPMGTSRRLACVVMGSPSERFAGVVGQPGPLTALQCDVARVRPTLEAVHNIGQPGTSFRQVRCVDLRDVSEADDLRAGAGTRDQRL